MKRKLLIAVAVFCYFNPVFARAEGVVTGTGVYRADEATCKRNLPEFQKHLEESGLRILGKIECKPVDGEVEAFEPHFKAASETAMTAETAVAGYVPSKSTCSKMLKGMLTAVADTDEIIVESDCVSVNIADLETDEVVEQYQPMVFLLKKI